ncbi:MAG: ISL3 family transposase, partial [Chloroflexi bacterium]|nr:ISL3 family transposase [Chloroflexota bacterium]
NPTCPRRIFSERLPQLTAPYRRQTQRLWGQQRHLALAHGGEAGARTAARHGVGVSAKTLLRRICHAPLAPSPTPRCLGIDDWALRKGQTYGTILVDLERHCPVDLLPDRSAVTLAQWLRAHPGVEIITRDRAGDYADGARQAAPEAVQVADRFHWVQNAHQVLQRLLERHSRQVREAAHAVNQQHVETHTPHAPQVVVVGESSSSPPAALAAASDGSPPARLLSKVQQHQQVRWAQRYALYQEVQRLRAAGGGIRHIARQLHIRRTTVLRFLAETFPEQATRPKRPNKLDPNLPYLEAQLRAGQDNAMQLWRELRDEHGYRGSRALVSRWVAAHRVLCPPATVLRVRPGARPQSPAPKLPSRFKTPSMRAAAWLLTTDTASLDQNQAQFVEHLQLRCPEVRIG